MNLKPLNIGELISKIPIVQGGMGVGVSLSGLASAVTLEGGIGVISAAHIGFMEPDFERNALKANIEALGKHIRIAKEKAKGGVIGVNIMTAMRHYDEFVKQSVINKADIIFSGAGLPIELPKFVKDTTTKIAPIISSVKAATVLLKMWDKRYGMTADAIVVEGPDAGGHLGFKPEALESGQDYDTELKDILSFIKSYEQKFSKTIPVIFGGGVYDKEDIAHYLDMGCAAVQMATRFVATDECDAHIRFKEAYVKSKKEDVVIINSPVGLPGRALLNDFVRNTLKGNQKIENCHACLTHCNPQDTPYCISRALIASVKGDVDNGLVFCGKNVYKVDGITSVHALMKELTN